VVVVETDCWDHSFVFLSSDVSRGRGENNPSGAAAPERRRGCLVLEEYYDQFHIDVSLSHLKLPTQAAKSPSRQERRASKQKNRRNTFLQQDTYLL
jgi:hypothetical protein